MSLNAATVSGFTEQIADAASMNGFIEQIAAKSSSMIQQPKNLKGRD